VLAGEAGQLLAGVLTAAVSVQDDGLGKLTTQHHPHRHRGQDQTISVGLACRDSPPRQ
jgi:hypothetical protein